MIRDNALILSGLLVDTTGGPSTKPYQPPNIWNEVSLNKGLRYKRDTGEKLYRKSMYIYWKRSAPMPNMIAFDAPTRENCVVIRQRTNTPLQALVTLNDIQFVEASRAMAQRVIKEGGKSAESQIAYAYKLATSKVPTKDIMKILLEEYNKQLSIYKKDSVKADALLKFGDSKREESIDKATHAAMTIITNLILNLDETLNKG